jgi:hypothetical protein
MPPVEKKEVEEMDVPGAPGTPAPAHAERNHPILDEGGVDT